MTNAIAIFDIGKTNKKLFLFDESYRIIYQRTEVIPEIKDEDGFPCEDMLLLTSFLMISWYEVLQLKDFNVKAVNFTAYGASFVCTDSNGDEVCPLYNYLKPYPASLLEKFYDEYGGKEAFALETASPVLGNLNSGMQLYRIKYQNPTLFHKIAHAYHLPQYIGHRITRNSFSDITSIGCHTNLWNFQLNRYHSWVAAEGILDKLLPIVSSIGTQVFLYNGKQYKAGIGLHDSSAALIPYLRHFREPFVLISTGTWCISLNPCNNSPLNVRELKNDCLCYLQYNGKPVKASRLFAGYMHDQQVKRIAAHFNLDESKYDHVAFNPGIVPGLQKDDEGLVSECAFEKRDLSSFSSDEEAYHQLIFDIVAQQRTSTDFVLTKDVRKIFVDGGFSKNEVYMKLLASTFPEMEVYATSMAQATALGAALAIHESWNEREIRDDLIELERVVV